MWQLIYDNVVAEMGKKKKIVAIELPKIGERELSG